MQQGVEQAFRRAALDILEERFASVPAEAATVLDEIEDADLLERLVRQAVTVESPIAFVGMARASASGQ